MLGKARQKFVTLTVVNGLQASLKSSSVFLHLSTHRDQSRNCVLHGLSRKNLQKEHDCFFASHASSSNKESSSSSSTSKTSSSCCTSSCSSFLLLLAIEDAPSIAASQNAKGFLKLNSLTFFFLCCTVSTAQATPITSEWCRNRLPTLPNIPSLFSQALSQNSATVAKLLHTTFETM